MRYLAADAVTGEWLARDLPLRAEVTWALRGQNALTATLDPEVARAKIDGRPLLTEWGTKVYAEDDGVIRWGGLYRSGEMAGPSWSLDCVGMARYLDKVDWTGNLKSTSIDPLDAYRALWEHAQSYASGDLGVAVDETTSPVRLGKPRERMEFDTADGGASFEAAEPYHLAPWDAPNCGQEASMLMTETPFDVEEHHAWADADHETVSHRLILGYPRLGRRRHDLRFVEGENITTPVPLSRDGDAYANEIIVLGRGEGRKRITGRAVATDGRLRCTYVHEDESIGTTRRADAVAAQLLRSRMSLGEITEITVAGECPVSPGDDIYVQAVQGWAEGETRWCRIASITVTPEETSTTRLVLTRSDRWRYGEG